MVNITTTSTDIIATLRNITIPTLLHTGSIRSILIVILMCVTGQCWGRGRTGGGISIQLTEITAHCMTTLWEILGTLRDSNTRNRGCQALTVPTHGTWRLRLRSFSRAISLWLKRSNPPASTPWWTTCWTGIKIRSIQCEDIKFKRLRRLLTFSLLDLKSSRLCLIGSRICKKAMKWTVSSQNHSRGR